MALPYREIKCNSFILAPIGTVSPPAKSRRSSGRSNFRAAHPKVRTGCRTCKARHVKCDELKPACNKCVATGRKCEGYGDDVLSRISKPAPAQVNADFMHYSLSINIPGDARARRTLHYFRCRSSDAMSRYFASDFWDYLVLQISHYHPTVRHALTALGSLYEEYEVTSPPKKRLATRDGESGIAFALKEYNKAVHLLSIDLASKDPPLEGILASCLIFTCLEFLRNNVNTALSHLAAGLRILNEATLPSAPAASTLPPKYANKTVNSSLSVLFKRLHTQAITHGCPSSVFTSASMPYASFSAVAPTTLTSLAHARLILDDILGSFFQLFSSYTLSLLKMQKLIPENLQLRQLRNNQQLTAYYNKNDPGSVAREHVVRSFLDRLEHWQSALENLVTCLRGEGTIDKTQEIAITLMRLHHRVVFTVLVKTPTTSEMQYDGYRDSFVEIVDLASLLIEGMDSDIAELPSLSVDMGVIAPLYFVILKCRDVPIRSRAMEMMRRAPAREGIWRRDSAVQFAEWKIEKEEEEAIILGWEPGEVIPEGARVYYETLTEVEKGDGRKVTVVTWRRRCGGEVLYLEEVVDMGIEMGEMI